MTILHVVTRSEQGGAQTVVRTLAEHSAARGHRVVVASGSEGDGAAWRGAAAGIEFRVVRSLRRAVRPLADSNACLELAALDREISPDVVHIHTSKAAALARLAFRQPRRNIVYTMHGYDQLRVANRGFLAVDRALRSRCAAIVAVSASDREAMVRDGYGDVYLIPNGSEEPTMRPADAVSVRIEALRAGGRKIVLVVARDAKPKRIDLARAIGAGLPDGATVVWVGNLEPAPPGPGIVFLGNAPAASGLLPLADVFLLPSDHEGMPMSVLEALAAGVPVVASAVGGVPEVLAHGGGVAVPNDPSAMASAIRRYLEDPLARRSASQDAFRNWTERYSARAMVDAYLEIYRTIEGSGRFGRATA